LCIHPDFLHEGRHQSRPWRPFAEEHLPLPSTNVEQAYLAFHRFDWTTPELLDLQPLFLRAARVVDNRSLDVPTPLRGQIASKLEKSGVPALQTAMVKGFIYTGRKVRPCQLVRRVTPPRPYPRSGTGPLQLSGRRPY
jgi:hypothetical protein